MSTASPPLKIVFAGTPEFARIALERIHTAGMQVVLVLTQPDRPAGRGMKLQASSVKQYALAHGMPVAQPHGLRLDGRFADDAAAARAAIEAADADAMVVAAYGLLLPQWVFDTLEAARADGRRRMGCINIHGSLLPRWRGAAPLQRAIEAGDRDTGVTIMQMDIGLDTGAMLGMQSLPIAPDDTSATLHDKVAELGASMVVEVLQSHASLRAVPQPAEGVTYARKIEKHEGVIDWLEDADLISRRIRAFNPFPGASATWKGETLKVWRAVPVPGDCEVPPATILDAGPTGIAVATGNGVLLLQELQRPGAKRLPVAQFLQGFELTPGMAFDQTPPAADRSGPIGPGFTPTN